MDWPGVSSEDGGKSGHPTQGLSLGSGRAATGSCEVCVQCTQVPGLRLGMGAAARLPPHSPQASRCGQGCVCWRERRLFLVHTEPLAGKQKAGASRISHCPPPSPQSCRSSGPYYMPAFKPSAFFPDPALSPGQRSDPFFWRGPIHSFCFSSCHWLLENQTSPRRTPDGSGPVGVRVSHS